ncbi:MAG: hypothetical protein GF419_13705 [Ignavibacteriales bacterium]|nr:hypothetical protein [Ignavibacteriales bacterium]
MKSFFSPEGSAKRGAARFAWLAAIELALLLAIKYATHGMTPFEGRILAFGNLMNVGVAAALVASSWAAARRNPEAFSRAGFVAAWAWLAGGAALALASFVAVFDPDLPNRYVLRQPLTRVVESGLFAAFFFRQLFLVAVFADVALGARRARYIRSAVNASLAVALFFVFGYVYTQHGDPNDFDELRAKPADAVVSLGAAVWSGNRPSTALKARLEKVYDLYRSGLAGRIFLTGGAAPGEISEALAAKYYLSRYPVAVSDIVIEEATGSTAEQIIYIKREVVSRGDVERVVVVTDRFHLARVKEMGDFFGVSLLGVPSDKTDYRSDLEYYRIREAISVTLFWLFATG